MQDLLCVWKPTSSSSHSHALPQYPPVNGHEGGASSGSPQSRDTGYSSDQSLPPTTIDHRQQRLLHPMPNGQLNSLVHRSSSVTTGPRITQCNAMQRNAALVQSSKSQSASSMLGGEASPGLVRRTGSAYEARGAQPKMGTRPMSEMVEDPRVQYRHKPAHRAEYADGPRRHTFIETQSNQFGAKHRALLSEERELVTRGLDVARRLQNWYSERISALEKKQKIAAGANVLPMEHAIYEERLNYLRAHVTELNRRSMTLMESSEKGFPSSLNIEFGRSIAQPADDQVRWMKQQNKMLSEEVSQKTSRIAQLEREKSQLIRQLFERGQPIRTLQSPASSNPMRQATLM